MRHKIDVWGALVAVVGALAAGQGWTQSLDELLSTPLSTPSRVMMRAMEAPASVTIITAEEIARWGYRTLAEVLTAMRSFYTRYDRNYAYVGVRGFGRPGDYNCRLLVLLDGHLLNETLFQQASIGTDLVIDLNALERIELVRGPGSALFGSNAMFAVANLVTKSPEQLDGVQASLLADSRRTVEGSLAVGRRFASGVGMVISGRAGDSRGGDLYFREYDHPATSSGIAHDLDWDRFVGATAAVDYRRLVVRAGWQAREKAIPTAAWDMAFDRRPATSLDRRGFVELTYQAPLAADKEVALRTSYDFYDFRGQYPYELMWYDYDVAKWLKGNAELRWDVRPNWRVVMGAEVRRDLTARFRLWDEHRTHLDADFPFSIWSLFAEGNWQVRPGLHLNLGLRGDNYSQGHHCLTPRAALVWRPTCGSAAKLLFGQGFRAPNPYELYYEDPDVTQGNPDLEPERVTTVEAVWEQRLGKHLYGTACVFHSAVRHLIDQVVTADSLLQFQNRQKERTGGAELELAARLPRGLWWQASYTYQRGVDALTGQALTNAPQHLGRGRLSLLVGRGLTASIEFVAESSRLTLARTRTAPFALTNLHLRSAPLWGHVRLGLTVRNRFDQNYEHPAGHEHRMAAIAQDRRIIAVSCEYRP